MQRQLVAVQRSTKEAISVSKKLPRDGNGSTAMVVSLHFIDAIHAWTQRLAAIGAFWAVLYRQGSLAVFPGQSGHTPTSPRKPTDCSSPPASSKRFDVST